MDPSDPNSGGASRHHIVQSVENSLARLQTDYIDLLYIHNYDYGTPVEDVLRTLTDVVRSGKVHYIGASNFTGWQVINELLPKKLSLLLFIFVIIGKGVFLVRFGLV